MHAEIAHDYYMLLLLLLQLFSTRQHYAERAICYRPPVRLSICLSHGWIGQKRLKLGSCNFQQLSPQSE